MDDLISRSAQVIASAEHVIFLSGAGISAESGIPTFRGKDGLWNNHRAEDLATPQAFKRDSKMVWQWYNWRKDLVKTKKPNTAHYAAADLQQLKKDMPIITQNVDGLHKIAGASDVIEMHGNIFRVKCTECSFKKELLETDSDDPRCEKCSAKLRPDIVWFGESLDMTVMSKISEHIARADAIVVVGTSGVVYPAAGFSQQIRHKGGTVIEVNPNPASATQIAKNDLVIAEKAGVAMPALTLALKELMG